MYSQTTPTISNRRKASGSRYCGHITPLSFLSYLLTYFQQLPTPGIRTVHVCCTRYLFIRTTTEKGIDPSATTQHSTPAFSQPLLPLLRFDFLPAQASKCRSARESTPYIDASSDLMGCRPPGGWEQDVCFGCEGLCVRKVP